MNKINGHKPGYRHTELGWIPEDWGIKKISDVASVNPGRRNLDDNIHVTFLTMADVSEEGKVVGGESATVAKVKNGFTYFEDGDILVAKITPCFENGKGALVKSLINGCGFGSTEFHVIRSGDPVLSEIIYYHTRLYDFRARGEQNMTGSAGQKRVPVNFIETYKIPIPNLSERKKIVKIINSWNAVIAKTEQLIQLSKKRKKVLTQQLLTGKKRLPGFVGDWQEIKFHELRNAKKWSITGGPFGSNLKASDYTESGVRIIQLQNIGDGELLNDYKIYTSEQKANELISCNIYPGDIILSKMGDPVARACFVPNYSPRYLMASDGIRLAVDDSKYNKKFILDYINSDLFRRYAVEASTGSTRMRIGLDDLKMIALKVPKLDEQNAIASILQTADNEIQLLIKKLNALKEQKIGLMQQLLTGKKRVITA